MTIENQKTLDNTEFLEVVRKTLKQAEQILVITGAGISAESGIPTFRSEGGWWRSHNPEELATYKAFIDNPRKIWEWYDYRRQILAAAKPNTAHETLALWERSGKKVEIITQNVDDLHERAGSSNVIHIHGSIWHVKCLNEGIVYEDRRVPLPELPPKCKQCGGLLRPYVVWFDEDSPPEVYEQIGKILTNGKIDLVFVIGTEATFDYIREWALRGRDLGALLVEINLKSTEFTPSVDIHLKGIASKVLTTICD